MSTEPGRATARLMVLAAALLFSTGGVAVKATSLSSWQVASFRCGVAVLVVLLILPASRRGWTWRAALVGVAYAGTMVAYVLANKLTTAANAIFLQSSAPLYILLLGPLWLGERIRRGDLFYLGALALGMAAFFVGVEEPSQTAPDPYRGNVAGAVSGLCWGLTLLGLRWLERTGEDGKVASAGGAVPAVLLGNLIAFLACLPAALPVESAEPRDWTVVLYLGAVQIALAYVFLTAGLRHVSALEGSLLLLLEPVLSPVWAFLVYGERSGPWATAGCFVILLAMVGRILGGRPSWRLLSAMRFGRKKA